jgi:hypothetical protein
VAAASDPVVCDGQVKDQDWKRGPRTLTAQSCALVAPESARVRGAGGRVVSKKVHPVLLTATQGGRVMVAAGEGGYLHLQTQCCADERFPQWLIPSIVVGRGPEGPEP